jgi:hypothetical protein
MQNVMHPWPMYCDIRVRVRDRFLGELTMDSSQRSSLGAAIRNKSRTGDRANRLTEVILLILIATAAIVLVVSATLALVGLN